MMWIGLVFAGISILLGMAFKSRAKQYAGMGLWNDLSGREMAEHMLADHGIRNVQVVCVQGELTDHYHPGKRTVNLSPDVYNGRSVLAAAVAAHECGHAVQHAKAYAPLQFRSALVPVLNVTSTFMPYIIMLGVFMINATPLPLWIGIALFSVTTVFSLVTLPVELDASSRALAWLKDRRITTPDEQDTAASALRWAASTYVVAALGSVVQLLYLLNLA